MRRVVALTAALVLLPASAAFAADLDELLDESRDAAYTAEQVITCSTPDGARREGAWSVRRPRSGQW